LASIVPGASVAFILIYFGLYQPLLDGVARLDGAFSCPSPSARGRRSWRLPARPIGCS
jgi:uncharacterized membrane protein